MAQQFNDIGDQLNELRQDNAALRESLDSLRAVLAKHDTTLSRLANVTGVVIAK
jgi:prefoldin subunit 5